MLLTETIREGVAPPWDCLEETYGVSPRYGRRPRSRQPKFPGLSGGRYEKAVEKGYVDLGLIDPEIGQDSSRRHWIKTVYKAASEILLKKGVAFIRDPSGYLQPADIERIAKQIPYEVAEWNVSHEDIEYASETDDYEQMTVLIAIRDAIEDTWKVKITPIRGRTGAGYRIAQNKPVDQIVQAAKKKAKARFRG